MKSQQSTNHYESVGDDTKITNELLSHIIMSKVDSKTRSKWEEKLEYQSIPSWIDCKSALNKRYQHLSAEANAGRRKNNNNNCREAPLAKQGGKTSLAVSQTTNTQGSKCLYCKSLYKLLFII